jgi:hypothetical protein
MPNSKDPNKENTGQLNNRWNHGNTFDSVSTILRMFKRNKKLYFIIIEGTSLLCESVCINTNPILGFREINSLRIQNNK